ncbi:hypothetical protein [Rhodococcus sp. AG1013]|uniref:hypothetical protein n=1 Tax=unclassified Rhodococcus (in: high G+C Gram-positive bacteria) TaxID=192944 RepID=UPI000E0C314B|nr:hypothetical protein [Rhodococcus sp. AG1013]RDI21063.1 CUB-like protein [Rhodococcus sp. AG1013]
MSQKRGRIAAAVLATVAAAPLSSCATNVDVPDTFSATVTFTGNANHASTDTGKCTFENGHVTPHDLAIITSGTATTTTTAALQLDTITQHPDGTTICTYTAHFNAIPANQPRYELTLNTFTQQTFTADNLKKGATYQLTGGT